MENMEKMKKRQREMGGRTGFCVRRREGTSEIRRRKRDGQKVAMIMGGERGL